MDKQLQFLRCIQTSKILDKILQLAEKLRKVNAVERVGKRKVLDSETTCQRTGKDLGIQRCPRCNGERCRIFDRMIP